MLDQVGIYLLLLPITKPSIKSSSSWPTIIRRQTPISNHTSELVDWLWGVPISAVQGKDRRATPKGSTTMSGETEKASRRNIHVRDKRNSPQPLPWDINFLFCLHSCLVNLHIQITLPVPHLVILLIGRAYLVLLPNMSKLALPSSRLNTLSTTNRNSNTLNSLLSFFSVTAQPTRSGLPILLLSSTTTQTLASPYSNYHFTFY